MHDHAAPLISALSVIVPVEPGDESWIELAQDLRALPSGAEILFVGPRMSPQAPAVIARDLAGPLRVRWITPPTPSVPDPAPKRAPDPRSVARDARARWLNEGARQAQHPQLWFLHSGSRFDEDALIALERALSEARQALHYFDLVFADGPELLWLNELAAFVRSRALDLPRGDQGFCVSRELFDWIEGFPEGTHGREDEAFVQCARELGIPVRPTGGHIRGSTREFRRRGWARVTAGHFAEDARAGVAEAWRKVLARLPRR
jgi:hypothetical protein